MKENTRRSRRVPGIPTSCKYALLLAAVVLFVAWESMTVRNLGSRDDEAALCDGTEINAMSAMCTPAERQHAKPKADFVSLHLQEHPIDLHGIQPRFWKPRWDSKLNDNADAGNSMEQASATHKLPLPCVQPDNEGPDDDWMTLAATSTGFIFIKPNKVASTSFAAVNLRIARNAALRQDLPSNDYNSPHHRRMCKARFEHGAARDLIRQPRGQSFLWTVLRHPTRRAVSLFFHFRVSRTKVEPTDENFERMLRNGLRPQLEDHYLDYMRLRPKGGNDDPVAAIRDIMANYDFMAVTERMDESIVVLQYLLNLPLDDMLFLNAKVHGGFDDARYKNRCVHIVPSFVTPYMQSFFRTDEYWQTTIRWDEVLHELANQSLDLTIESIGRERFDKALSRYRVELKRARDACTEEAVFPCSVGGTKMPDELTQKDCFVHDMGCGTPCLDRHVQANGLSHVYFDG